MTVRLLIDWYDSRNGRQYVAGNLLTTDSGTETGLVAAKMADANLVGGTAYLPPPVSSISMSAALSIGSGALGGSAKLTGSVPVPQLSARSMRRWRTALGKVRDGQGNAKLALFGDSTFAGSGASGVALYPAGARQKGPVPKLAAMLNQYYCPAVSHAIFGDQNVGAGFYAWDTRFSAGAGWGITAANNSWGSVYNNSTTTNDLQFTPTGNVDTFVVWYLVNTGTRNFTWAVDGGATNNVNCGGTAAMQSVVIPAGASGTHTLKLARVNGSINIQGIQAYDSATKCVELLQMGRSGGRASTATASNAQPWDALNMLATVAPDLTIINLTINEWLNSGGLSQYKADLQTIINTSTLSGDVILMTSVPSEITQAGLSTQKQYVDAVADLAAINGLPFVDIWSRFGSKESSAALYTDTLHPNGAGYADMIMPIYNLLTQL